MAGGRELELELELKLEPEASKTVSLTLSDDEGRLARNTPDRRRTGRKILKPHLELKLQQTSLGYRSGC